MTVRALEIESFLFEFTKQENTGKVDIVITDLAHYSSSAVAEYASRKLTFIAVDEELGDSYMDRLSKKAVDEVKVVAEAILGDRPNASSGSEFGAPLLLEDAASIMASHMFRTS
ncbi:hypothetical protein [Lysinibacter cavernae]|uniref:hypothetical protein n=1 Tax=Lysinibacter cavernae TaxID=1640652 RepID=UPI00361B5B30